MVCMLGFVWQKSDNTQDAGHEREDPQIKTSWSEFVATSYLAGPRVDCPGAFAEYIQQRRQSTDPSLSGLNRLTYKFVRSDCEVEPQKMATTAGTRTTSQQCRTEAARRTRATVHGRFKRGIEAKGWIEHGKQSLNMHRLYIRCTSHRSNRVRFPLNAADLTR